MSATSSVERKNAYRVGSRKSQLALAQTQKVVDALREICPDASFEIVSMTTKGDNIVDKALSSIGDKSLFTKELEVALIAKSVDLIVHSLKDVPTALPPGLVVGAICKRDDPRDALIISQKCDANNLSELPNGSVVGTSSARRTAQLKKLYPHLSVQDVRGNLNTRLKKLDEGTFDALVLAAAGLERLGWYDRITQILDSDDAMYAVGQGAICVECRSDDELTIEMLSSLVDPKTTIQAIAERSFLKRLEGGCSIPVAVRCGIVEDELILEGGVYSADGTDSRTSSASCHYDGFLNLHKTLTDDNDEIQEYTGIYIPSLSSGLQVKAQNLGFQLADQLKEMGAAFILEEAKKQTAEKLSAKKKKPQTAE